MRNAIVNAALGLGLLAMELAAGASATAQDKARRGEYLATIMDCAWSEGDIVTAVRTGARPDGRILAPVMPHHISPGSPMPTRRRLPCT